MIKTREEIENELKRLEDMYKRTLEFFNIGDIGMPQDYMLFTNALYRTDVRYKTLKWVLNEDEDREGDKTKDRRNR